MRKTALLTGVAGLFLMTAPAFAQDSTAPQTPSAGEAAAQEAPAQPQQLTLEPGAVVRDGTGAELGRLEGVRSGASGQELTVRGADGQLRGVPTTGIRQDGDAVVVDFTSSQYMSAPAIADAAPAPATPPDPSAIAQPTPATEPSQPASPSEPAAIPSPAQPPAGEAAEPTDDGADDTAEPPAPGEDDGEPGV